MASVMKMAQIEREIKGPPMAKIGIHMAIIGI
jgi:hypothetical protein